MSKFIDLTGQKFGRLTVIKLHHKDKRRNSKGMIVGTTLFWLCQCECGNETIVLTNDLKRGHTKSCGCSKVKHNMSHSRLYNVWHSIQLRCYNPNNKNYKNYGAKGIKMCEEWEKNFQNFYDWAIENGYKDDLPRGECTIDRIDFNKGYSPDNCRWITIKEQQNNKSTNHYFNFRGKKQTISQWAKEYNIKSGTLHKRLTKYNMNIEKALTIPVKPSGRKPKIN